MKTKTKKSDRERDEKILYWAKRLEHKSLSVNELVENAKWLLDHIR